MPTTFTVFSLGNLADMDTSEGNGVAENASALVGMTFGGIHDALLNNAQTFSPGSTGFNGGTNGVYDQDNSPAEAFSINGGADQTYDSSAIFNATITYSDGTTASITAVVFQDTAGNTYLAPEFTANVDQTALEAGPIRSITLDSVSGNDFSGLTANRQTWNHVTCYVDGTRILTPNGETAIENLSVGDVVTTRDNGPQTIRWIGVTSVPATGNLAPVKITCGSLGRDLPSRDLYVSRQHRMLVGSTISEKMFGQSEVLIPAIKLVGTPGIEVEERAAEVTYYHLLLDRHEVIYAEGAPSESFLTGPGALAALDKDTVAELEALFPEVMAEAAISARPIVQDRRVKTFIRRHRANEKALVSCH